MMTDDVLRITVVWSTVAVFWHATGEAVAASAGLSGSTLLLYGYIGVALVMTIGRGITETFISLRSNETYKLGVEAAYIAMSAVAGITLWEGTAPASFTSRCLCNNCHPTVHVSNHCSYT